MNPDERERVKPKAVNAAKGTEGSTNGGGQPGLILLHGSPLNLKACPASTLNQGSRTGFGLGMGGVPPIAPLNNCPKAGLPPSCPTGDRLIADKTPGPRLGRSLV